ncbi:hypothetical protein E8E13_007609 [Curvularia kusanoi]|uniref:DUF202 domain-containing protein n=1 Tax=Curvularia kusanoi TaxID=90978 RepID=A0A9P4TDJ8_CURKU|nr:hypothetical protein E8E13_007609 [Curvularia kusanoi]
MIQIHEEQAATLHDCTRRAFHPDSEDAVRIEQQRVARELRPYKISASTQVALHTDDQDDGVPSRLRLSSHRSSIATNAPLRNYESLASYATTQSNVSHIRDNSIREEHWYDPLVDFWTTHISLTIDEGAHRDHLALERTFLGYLRTSLILVMTGVIIAQLFRIQHSMSPDPQIGFYVVGEPLSVVFIGMAIFVLLVGAIRFLRLQNALVRGKALVGGWEVFAIMAMSALLLVATFALILAVNIDKAKE